MQFNDLRTCILEGANLICVMSLHFENNRTFLGLFSEYTTLVLLIDSPQMNAIAIATEPTNYSPLGEKRAWLWISYNDQGYNNPASHTLKAIRLSIEIVMNWWSTLSLLYRVIISEKFM